MRKYHLYAAAICTAAVLGISGCSSQTNSTSATSSSETTSEQTQESTVVEAVTGTIESMEESQPELPGSIRVYGPATKLEDGRISLDNQSDMSSSGEMILNLSDQTYILDAVTGLPVAFDEIKDGDTIYAYIGPAMTMSLPPMTNAQLILTNIPADFKVPDYVEVKSVVTDAATSESVLTTADGDTFTLSKDCSIFPYLTRNIVTLDDLTQGRTCLVWSDEENVATKIMVFAPSSEETASEGSEAADPGAPVQLEAETAAEQ